MPEPVMYNPGAAASAGAQPVGEEVHIASYLVHVQPGSEGPVLDAIVRNPALECRVQGTGGKLVVVAEAPDQGRILDDMHDLEQQPGVLACTLVYHEVMSGAEAAQTLIPAAASMSSQAAPQSTQDQHIQDLSHETDPS